MRVIDVDDETIELLEGAAITLEQALAARARRVDPDGLISRSLEMSRIKTAEALRQFRRGPPLDWSKMDAGHKAAFDELLLVFQASEDEGIKDLAFKKLRSAMFRYSEWPTIENLGEPMSQEEADRRENADFATDAAANARRVRAVREKQGKGMAPQSKAS